MGSAWSPSGSRCSRTRRRSSRTSGPLGAAHANVPRRQHDAGVSVTSSACRSREAISAGAVDMSLRFAGGLSIANIWLLTDTVHRQTMLGMSDDAARTQGPDLLRQAMKEAGITQMALEAKLGASKGLTSRWLSGERVPELRFALALEDILGVPARAWLATERPESPTAA